MQINKKKKKIVRRELISFFLSKKKIMATVDDNDSDSKMDNESNSELQNSEIKEESAKIILPEPLTKLSPPLNVYFLEQMKNGLSISNISIIKNRLIFGRARDCDIPMDHPSISRYHAALLWAPKNDHEFENG